MQKIYPVKHFDHSLRFEIIYYSHNCKIKKLAQINLVLLRRSPRKYDSYKLYEPDTNIP